MEDKIPAPQKDDPKQQLMMIVSWLIKFTCIDRNQEQAKILVDMVHEKKSMGEYEIIIRKI